jgi:hypothetical protein
VQVGVARKPCTFPAESVYRPTAFAALLMPRDRVSVAPGKSRVMKLLFWSRNP